jgi:hypothetical protein
MLQRKACAKRAARKAKNGPLNQPFSVNASARDAVNSGNIRKCGIEGYY